MAYTRGHFYAYSTGDYFCIHHGWDHDEDPDCTIEGESDPTHVTLPTPYFEELCAMYWARMAPEEQEDAKRRAIAKWGGNFGSDGLREEFGEPSLMDEILQEIEAEDDNEPRVYRQVTSNKVYCFIRIRILGAINVFEGIGQIIVGSRMPSVAMKIMFWELRTPRLRRWNTHVVARTDENA